MLNSQLVAKPNPLSALSGLCWSAAVVLLPSQASKALCAAAVQRRSAELTPERLPNIPRIQQPSADKSETRVPWGKLMPCVSVGARADVRVPVAADGARDAPAAALAQAGAGPGDMG